MVAAIAAAMISTSCENEKDFFKQYNTAANIQFLRSGGNYSDTLADSVKLGYADTCYVKIDDENSNVWVKYSENNLNIYLQDSLITQRRIKAQPGQSLLIAKGLKAGRFDGTIFLNDVYGLETQRKVKFTVFENLEPIALLKVDVIKQVSPLEISIDLSKSYDKDATYGGKIEEYEYRIGEFYVLSSAKFRSIKYVLPKQGSYLIKCRVKDNNKVWSKDVSFEVTV